MQNIFFRAIINFIFISVCYVPLVAQININDENIEKAVNAALERAPVKFSNNILVESKDGIIGLSGVVPSLFEKNYAVRMVESVKGVLGVVNRVKVSKSGKTDKKIQTDVIEALNEDSATDSYAFQVEVEEGYVRLSGEVPSWNLKSITQSIVENVGGVRGVKNDVFFAYEEDRSSEAIEDEIKKLLLYDPYVFADLIEVQVQGEEAILSGTVASAAGLRHLKNNAMVMGISSVDTSNVKIDWDIGNPFRRETSLVLKSDEEIKKALRDVLIYDPRIPKEKIDVQIEAGKVILKGVVSRLGVKKAATQDAINIIGVRSVENNIQVISSGNFNPELVEEKIEKALKRDPLLDHYDFLVDAKNAAVTLRGSVSSFYEKQRAGEIASNIQGIAEVNNNLVVTSQWKTKTDLQIKNNIQGQFAWSVFVDGEDLNLEVENAKATISGDIDNLSEVNPIVHNAFEGGAKVVDVFLIVGESQIPYEGTYYWDNYYDFSVSYP